MRAKRVSFGWSGLVGACLLAGAFSFGSSSSGCLLAKRGPSNVAQGLHYSSGDTTYDSFFDTLFQAQLKMGSAPDDEQNIRRTLARTVGANDVIDPAQLAQAVDKHTDRMAKAGVGVSLTVAGLETPDAAPSVKLETNGGQADENDRKILEAIDTAAQAEAKLLGDMRQVKVASNRLRDEASTLEPGVDTAFRHDGPGKRAEVSKNLKDAQALIPLMIQRADEVQKASKDMLDHLAHVANTRNKVAPPSGSETPKIILEEDTAEKAPKPKGPPRAPAQSAAPRARPATQPAAAPPPPPPPPPPPKDDFEP